MFPFILENQEQINIELDNIKNSNTEPTRSSRFSAALPVYFIPGIEQVALTATGIVIVGVGVVAVGSFLYNVITDWISSFDRSPSSKINWDGADKNHVMRGSGDGHVAGFKKLGFDPKDPKK